MDDKHNRDAGFSLVEMIVVVLIMGIIAGVAIISVGRITSVKVDGATKVLGSVLKQARAKAMGLTNTVSVDGDTGIETSDIFVMISVKGSNIFAEIYQKEAGHSEPKLLLSEKIGNNKLELSFSNHKKPSALWNLIASGDDKCVKIYFKKSTGSIAGIYFVDGKDDESISESDYVAWDSDTSTYCDTICLFSADDKKKLILVHETGRCYMDSEYGVTPTAAPEESDEPEVTSTPEPEETT